MKDKRDECNCHKECVTPHRCPFPCFWPDCLTDAEQEELLGELNEDCE